MTPERWEQISRVFKSALERRGAERAAFLASACGGDATLRREVEALLASFDKDDAVKDNAEDAGSHVTYSDDAPPATANASGLWTGQEIGHYLLAESLGAGGMGVVYRAEDQVLRRPVAIKFIDKRRHASANVGRRFLREARAASQLNHPNIVTVHEIDETDDYAYIVMELVRGRSLREHLRGHALDPKEALDIAAQTAAALAEAHAHGLVHRDIKPENILVSDRGAVKLADFGLARTFDTSRPFTDEGALTIAAIETLTDAGAVVGTVPYMSPEQLRKEPLDARTDLFSFGIVLYEMVSGRHPFAAGSSYEIAAAILGGVRPPTERLARNLPEGLVGLLFSLLEHDRERRPDSFDEVARELARLRALPPAASSMPHPPEVQYATQRFDAPRAAESRAGPSAHPTHAPVQPPTHASSTNAPSAFSAHSLMPGVPRTILVLPFEAVGTQEETTFIGVGLASVITTDLAKIGEISVLSKTAGAGRASQTGQGARELARELGANILLEGEVQRAGKQLRITARVTDVETGRVIWGDQYSGDESELFKIQDAVCESVAAALKVTVSQEARMQMQPPTINLDAFELYSRGRAFLERRDHRRNIDLAVSVFYEALRLDPQFALAHAGLGESFWFKYEATREPVWVERAVAASDRALVLDPHQAQVHITLGIVYHGTGKIDTAVEEFTRALELQPLSDDAHRWLGKCFIHTDELERARLHFERAVALRPGYWDNYNWLGNFYYLAGDYQAAAEQFRRVITFQPDSPFGYGNLGGIYCVLGRYEDAAAMHLRAIEIHPAATLYSNLGTDYFFLGRHEEAAAAYRSALDLEPSSDVYRRNLGDALQRLGRAEEACREYERARELLEERLAVQPNNARYLGRLAVCQAKLGRAADALVSIETATALEPRNTVLMYQSSVVHALAGEETRACEALARALEHGYSRTEAARDPDLSALRRTEAYRNLLGADDPLSDPGGGTDHRRV